MSPTLRTYLITQLVCMFLLGCSLAPTAKEYVSLGDSFFKEKKYAESITSYGKALETVPSSSTWSKRAWAYLRQKDYQKAIDDCTRSIELNSNAAWPYALRADAYNSLNQYQKALTDAEQAISLKPRYAYAYRLRADIYRSLGQSQKSIDDCNKAMELDSSESEPYAIRAAVQLGLGKYKDAIADSSTHLKMDPDCAWAFLIRADSSCNLQQYDKALADFSSSIKNDPEYETAYQHRCALYLLQKKYDKAMEDCETVLRLNPSSADGYCIKSQIHAAMDKTDLAFIDLKKGLEKDPKSINCLFTRAIFYFQNSQPKEALADLNSVIALAPKSAALPLIYRACVNAELKNTNEAIADMKRSLELATNDLKNYPDFLIQLGTTQMILEHYNEGIAAYNKALPKAPPELQLLLYSNQAHCYEKLHQYPELLQAALKASKIEANNPVCLANRAMGYARNGKLESALIDANKVILSGSTLPESYTIRGFIYYKLRQYDKAEADQDKAIKMMEQPLSVERQKFLPPSNKDIGESYHYRSLICEKLGKKEKSAQDRKRASELGFKPSKWDY